MEQISRPGWSCRYGYSRATECREADDPGQDYLTLDIGDNRLQFVLCDGISQSYYGELAAKLVGDRLLDWLADIGVPSPADQVQLQRRWENSLRELTITADELLRQHVISPDIQGMLREVLSDKKRLGSATMYCGGRIDFPDNAIPEGRILLAWQGDIRCRIWNGTAEATEARLGNRFDTREQWNSVAGSIGGRPHLMVDRLLRENKRGELLIYSDGLQVLDRLDIVPAQQLAAAAAEEARHPASDDISYLQIQWDYTLLQGEG